MKNKKVKIILGIVILCIVICTVIVIASRYFSNAKYYIYERKGNKVSITGLLEKYSDLEEINIPKRIGLYEVTEIDDDAFKDNNKIKKVIINVPLSIMGNSCFYECNSLEEVYLNGIKFMRGFSFAECDNLGVVHINSDNYTIYGSAFENCISLEEVKLSSGISRISVSTFEGCISLKTIELPDGVEEIGQRVFYGCENLEEIKIPASVTSILEKAFEGCNKVTFVTPKGSYAEQYAIENGIKYRNE